MAQIKKKVKIREKQPPKKSKWWFWLLLVLVLIVPVGIVAINLFSNGTNEIVSEKSEQATTKANGIAADLQNPNTNFEEAQAKAEEPQKSVDETKANAQTDEEKQVVAEAQPKVDDAANAVEAANKATQTSSVDETPTPGQEEVIASTTAHSEKKTSDQTTIKKPVASDTQGSQSPTNKTDDRLSTTPSITVSSGTLEQEAKSVIRGIYGNGDDRKRALGRRYDVIQSKVNEMYRNGEVK